VSKNSENLLDISVFIYYTALGRFVMAKSLEWFFRVFVDYVTNHHNNGYINVDVQRVNKRSVKEIQLPSGGTKDTVESRLK